MSTAFSSPAPARRALRASCALLLCVAPASAQETDAERDAANQRAVDAASGRSSAWPGDSAHPTSGAGTESRGFTGESYGFLVTFFPPTPPWYGGMLPPAHSTSLTIINGRKTTPPDELADHVGEIFYPALGTRLFNHDLSGRLASRLSRYRAARTTLLDELLGELARLQLASRAERVAALRELAGRQSGRIAALEADAEQLRHDLVTGGFFGSDVDWNRFRAWHLGSVAVSRSPMKEEAEFQVTRATSFFQEGLSIEQRGLVRELAMDLSRAARVARGERASADDEPTAMFFSPETARFRMPSPFPPELLKKIGRFNSDKAALKAELLQAIMDAEKLAPSKRTRHFVQRAQEHAGRIAALEVEAEEIRHHLDELPNTPLPWLPPIPPDLRQRIEAYNRDRQALLAEYTAAQLHVIRRTRQPAKVDDSVEAGSTERALQQLRNFENTHAERIEDLRSRHEAIRRHLAELARDLVDPRTSRPLTAETLLEANRVAMQRFDTIGREEAMYERYRIAMFQPGLSPAQRRLLFRAAHANLAQALPMGELIRSTASRPTPRS